MLFLSPSPLCMSPTRQPTPLTALPPHERRLLSRSDRNRWPHRRQCPRRWEEFWNRTEWNNNKRTRRNVFRRTRIRVRADTIVKRGYRSFSSVSHSRSSRVHDGTAKIADFPRVFPRINATLGQIFYYYFFGDKNRVETLRMYPVYVRSTFFDTEY